MPASTSRQRSNAVSSPLANTTRSFLAAWAPVPLTGQSSRILPWAASCASPRAFTSIGKVLHSMTIWPLPLLEAMPPWPAITCSKASTLGREGDQDLGLSSAAGNYSTIPRRLWMITEAEKGHFGLEYAGIWVFALRQLLLLPSS